MHKYNLSWTIPRRSWHVLDQKLRFGQAFGQTLRTSNRCPLA
ncbi:hypothetical protein PDR5_10720 [Pseudomonas sp. DR 5-09]|nr:hypothetical protein PDR5_10720 [Pseudomonas sp. DR 5-09]